MGLHPVIVARDLQRARVAELEAEFSQFSSALVTAHALQQHVETAREGYREAEETLELERATAPDSDLGREIIRSAEHDLRISQTLLDMTRQELDRRLKLDSLTAIDLDRVGKVKQLKHEAENRLRQLQSELEDSAHTLYLERFDRQAQMEQVARLGNGRFVNAERLLSLAHRFAAPKKSKHRSTLPYADKGRPYEGKKW